MNPALLSLLAIIACAPVAHRLAAPGSARSSTAPAPRSVVAVVLSNDEPLATAPDAHAGHRGAASNAKDSGSVVLSAGKPLATAPDAHAGHHHAAPTAVKDPVAVARSADKPLATAPDAHAGHHHAAPTATVKDPVCGMTLDPTKAKGGSITVDGKTFHFCSSSCRREFEAADGGLR